MFYKFHFSFIGLFSSLVFSQGLDERIAPLALPNEKPLSIIDSFPNSVRSDSNYNEVLVDKIASIQVFGDPSYFSDKPNINLKGVIFKKLSFGDEKQLKIILSSYIGLPLTLSTLEKINNKIIDWFRSQDFPIVNVIAPSGQDITDGHLQIIALVAQRGDLDINDGEFFSSEDINNQFRIGHGDLLRFSKLQEELSWANRNPFRKVKLQLLPGKEVSFADIILKIEDRFPLRVYSGLDDAGSRSTSKSRYLAGFNWGNAFGVGHQFGYQYASSKNNNSFKAHSFNYLAPLKSRHSLSFYGSFVNSLPIADVGFDVEGKNQEFGFNYKIPFDFFPNLKSDVSFGYNFKRSNNNVMFGAEEVSDTLIDISELNFNVSAYRLGENSHTNASININISPGGTTSNNTDTAFELAKSGSASRYEYVVFSIKHTEFLSNSWLWNIETISQWSSSRLLSSQQFGLGGNGSIRGYESFSASGDYGIIFRNELVTPTVQPLSNFKFGVASYGRLHGLVFFDYGVVKNHISLADEKSRTVLQSAGLGARFSIGSLFSGRFDYAWPLSGGLSIHNKSPRAHFSLVLSY